MLLTITPDGALRGLQKKPGKGIDVRKFLGGTATIVRSSLVEFCEKRQQWHLTFVSGNFAGTVGQRALDAAKTPRAAFSARAEWAEEIPYWEDYDDAVAAEIVLIEALRLRGYTV